MKLLLSIAAGAAFVAASSSLQAGTEIVDGFNASIAEITSPDDLHLDPALLIVAVDAFGNEDREVNGVTFQTDRCDGCPDTEGEVESDVGVTYRSTSTHFIDGWASPPNFSGGIGDSADNLAAIMEDIRWSAAPGAVTIEVEGLPASAAVEVQLLFSEGADRDRRWDIGVVDGDPEDIDEDGLIFDDIQSEGISDDSDLGDRGVWTDENSVVATFTVNANAEGKLTVVMQQHIGGQDPPGGDNNPILQAAILHSIGGGIEVVHGKEEILDEGTPDGWDLTVFVVDPLLTSEGTDADGTPDGTVTSWTAAFREDRADGDHTAAPVLAKRDTDSGDIVVVGVGDLVTPEEGGIFTMPWGLGTGSNEIDISEAGTEWLMGVYQGGPNGNNAGAVIPFAGAGEYPMFAWDTADLPPEPDDLVNAGHASFDSPAAREYQFNFTVSWGGLSNNDIDGDGLPNFWEEANGLDPEDLADAASDADNDGLTALQEFERKTDPNKADTDEDGLSDKVETGTGVWVSAEDTGTNPRKTDTDKDKLPDGVETNTGIFVSATDTGTDPHKTDSDGDNHNDGAEVASETDPTNINDFPEVLVVCPDCDDQPEFGTEDWEDGSGGPDGWDLTVVFTTPIEPTEEFEGETSGIVEYINYFHAESRTEGDHTVAPVLVKYNEADDEYTVFGVGQMHVASEQGPQVKVPFIVAQGSNEIDLTEEGVTWHAAAYQGHPGFGNNSNGAVIPFSSDGAGMFAYDNGPDEELEEGQVLSNGHASGEGGRHYMFNFGINWRPGGGTVFQITEITRSATEVSLTWNSRKSGEYSVEYRENLAEGVWIELDDGVAGEEGDSTSFTDDDAGRAGLPEGYYRVREN